MTTTANLVTKYDPYYKLVAVLIEIAVKEFNFGSTAQRQEAAAFFRDSYNSWMYEEVGATVHDTIRNRLDGDPFDMKSLKKAVPVKNKACRPAKKVMFRGRSLTLPEWAAELGIEYKTLYARYKRYGSCARVFGSY